MRGLPTDVYCDLVESARQQCALQSVLEIWNFNGDIIKTLTENDIVRAISNVKVR